MGFSLGVYGWRGEGLEIKLARLCYLLFFIFFGLLSVSFVFLIVDWGEGVLVLFFVVVFFGSYFLFLLNIVYCLTFLH